MELVAALAAAVRMHLPAALARPAQTDRSCRNQGSHRSANEAGCCPRCRSANGAGCCPRRCRANATACCPHRSANGARRTARCLCSTCSDRPSLLHSPPQCECTCLLPSLDLLRQTVAPRPRQPAQCEWSGCTRRRSAAAVRMHLPAAPTAVRMEPPSLRDQGSQRSANGAAALAAAVRPQCECTCLLPPP